MDVVIVGAGGHGKVVLDILRAAGRQVFAFLDADARLMGTRVGGLPVLGPVSQLPKLWQQKVRHAIVAIGDNATRRRYGALLREQGFELINAIHPSAVVSASASHGENVVIAANAVISTESRIEDFVIVNNGAIVDHECHVGIAAHLTPGVKLAGRVRVGEEAFIGLGACIIQCLSIGRRAVVGAGAVVLRDVPDETTVVGVPAKALPAGRSAGINHTFSSTYAE